MTSHGFTKFEVVMGLAAVSIAVLVMFPPLQGGVEKDQAMRAWEKAETIAWAVIDYRKDTGKWPEMRSGSLDLTCLTQSGAKTGHSTPTTPALAGIHGGANPLTKLATMAPNGLEEFSKIDPQPWLEEVPLDSWDRPFNIWILDLDIDQNLRTVVVISSGPDGILQTDPEVWPETSLELAKAGIETGARYGAAVVPEGLFLGDDLGFILAQATTPPWSGGAR